VASAASAGSAFSWRSLGSAFSSETTGALFGERRREGIWFTAAVLAGTALALAWGAGRSRD
jgi:hypothetical protein